VTDPLPPTVKDLQPSARFVYRELARAGEPLTVAQLRDRTGYSLRGLRHATTALIEEGLVIDSYSSADAREKQFSPADRP